MPEALAPGFRPQPSLDLQFFGGKTIAQLSFANLYVDGGRGWSTDDRNRIDGALGAALADPSLEQVLAQYFDGEQASATFLGSQPLTAPAPSRVDKNVVEGWLADLHSAGGLPATSDVASTVFDFLLPPGIVLADDLTDSLSGLGGYHGSIHADATTLYYAIGVYSERTPSGDNGIVAFDEPWKNVVATFYHELQEVATDPDVEDAIGADDANGERFLGWYSRQGGEIGDIPIEEAGSNLGLVLKEVPLSDGSGVVPIQLMWSNELHGPDDPTA